MARRRKRSPPKRLRRLTPAITLANFLTPLFLLGGPSTGPDDPPDPGYRSEPYPAATTVVTGSGGGFNNYRWFL